MAAPSNAKPLPYPQAAVLDMNVALVCLVVNIILPGIGTIVSGVVGEKPQIGKGVAQFILSIIIVGWIWAIVTGVQLVSNAQWKQNSGATPAA